jgi:UDP-N-acetyl-2-amino-2-deoxyglucuronate dehydrogenase
VREYGFGIVGCGAIGPIHADAIAMTERARLVAVCDVVPERADEVASAHRAKAYYDYPEMLRDQDIEIVCVCTPSGMHSAMGIEAAKARKHVLTEKPIDITLKATDALIAACRAQEVKLGVIFQHRYDEGAIEIKKAIETARFGKLLLCDAYVKWYRMQSYYDDVPWHGTVDMDGGGAIINQSIHFVDLLRWLAGDVAAVQAKTATVAHKMEGEDLGVAILEYANGAMGVIEGSTAIYPGLSEKVEIHGQKGTAVLEGAQVTSWQIQGEQERKTGPLEEPTWKSGAADPKNVAIAGHAAQIAEMIASIENDREPAVTGEEGRAALEIVLAIYESSKTGARVSLPLARRR